MTLHDFEDGTRPPKDERKDTHTMKKRYSNVDMAAVRKCGAVAAGAVAREVLRHLDMGSSVLSRPSEGGEWREVRVIRDPYRPMNPDGSDAPTTEPETRCYAVHDGIDGYVTEGGGGFYNPHVILVENPMGWPLDRFLEEER